MEKQQFVGELAPGDIINSVFLVASAQQNQARNGPYWRVEFRDSTGKIEGKIWSPLSQQFPDLKAGAFAELQGRVVVYRERNEIAVDNMRLLSEEESRALSLCDFLVSSSQDSDAMLEELEALCRKNFTHKPWSKFYKSVLRDEEIQQKLRISPAAKAMHHAYAGGLLEHTLGVCRLAMAYADLYPHLDRQVLLAGALCHDLGKIWELSSGLLVEYTSEGRLLGHMSIALERLEPFLRKSGLEPELAEHLKHLVLSHHGTREFGSPCLPATAEAMALHYADNMDAKMNQIHGALEVVPQGESGWSGYISGLDRALFRAVPSPEGDPARVKSSKKLQERQCSLLLKE
ncbi:HD domain-containing protein [Desulfovibrio sp. OttesenSCG-928-C06]|nr:HD domain-containing protein [Desulfovibrio sp. OttesenSCG-928-C06]